VVRGSSLDHPWLAIAVMCVSGVVEGMALRASIRSIEPRHRARGLFHWFRESGRPAVMLAVSEDLAALAGVIVSLIAVGLSMFTDDPVYDSLGSIGVGIVLMATALFSMREIKSLLVGESAHRQTREAMRQWLEARPELRRIVSLIVLKWSDDLVVAVQAELGPHESADELVRTIDRLENELRAQFPAARWIFFEPELREHGRDPL
jgi:divalent metal cation (Fe/Co/Zn/Cd) transporter